MCKRVIILAYLLLCFSNFLFAQKVTNIRPFFLSGTFSSIAGTPRVILTQQGSWLVVWRQGSSGGIVGRLVYPNASMGGTRNLQTTDAFVENTFDIAQNISGKYVLVYETTQGLYSQLLSAQLGKEGAPKLIVSGSTGMVPRIAFIPNKGQFLVACLVSAGGRAARQLKGWILDQNGTKILDFPLENAPGGSYFDSLAMVGNPSSGNLTLSFLSLNSSNGKLHGLNLSPNGTVINRPPFQLVTEGLSSGGNLTFSTSNVGLGVWAENGFLKNKRINGTALSGATISPSQIADLNTLQPGAVYDKKSRQFIAVWAVANKIQSTFVNSNTGKFGQPTQLISLGSPLAFGRNVSMSVESATNRVLAVWEDSNRQASTNGTGASFRIHGVIFETSSIGPDPDPDPDPDPEGVPDIACEECVNGQFDIHAGSGDQKAENLHLINEGRGELKIANVRLSATDDNDGGVICHRVGINRDFCSNGEFPAGEGCLIVINCVDEGCPLSSFSPDLIILSNDPSKSEFRVQINCD